MGTLTIRLNADDMKRFKKYVLETEGSFRAQSKVAARAINHYLDTMGWPKEEVEHDRE